ncbi:alpha/beta hydrolase [Streptomyces sp. NBC_00414]|uniref:alpha/beta hydrolase n=1 Tax=Streptomyces sp. NBC_00414 TaxID=2975739 RepID=UPI002E1E627B
MIRDQVSLAVHDHGGEGTPLLLLHGAGRTLADWAAVAPLLARHHRVLAVDLRGHGLSPDGTWSVPGVLGDIEAVLARHGIPEALPVGHSLGGMLAVRYALAHPDRTPAAVNLDGYGWGRPDRYVGLDPTDVEEWLSRMRELASQTSGRILPRGGLADLLAEQRAMSGRLGIPYELLEAGVRRSLHERADGRLELRPGREHALEMQAEIHSLDLLGLFRRMDRPLLLGRALRPAPPVPGIDRFDELMAARATGLAQDLAELAERHSEVTVAGIDGTHAMLLENPRAVADVILEFAARLPGTRRPSL